MKIEMNDNETFVAGLIIGIVIGLLMLYIIFN